LLDSLMGVVIVLNSIVIGLSADLALDWVGWLILDTVFAGLFSMELVCKLYISGCRTFFTGDDRRWNWFEVLSVALADIEVVFMFTDPDFGDSSASLSLFRILRLLRITRLARLTRIGFLGDLLTMMKGALGGMRTLIWSVILISLPLYACSIALRETLGQRFQEGRGAESFANVPLAFFTLFRCTVGNECTDHSGRPIFALAAERYGWGYGFFFSLVQVFMTFGLFNVIVAIFIENVLAGAKTNEQVMKRQRLRDQSFFALKMTELVAVILRVADDMSENPSYSRMPLEPDALLEAAANLEITPQILDQVRQRPGVIDILHDLELADEDAFNLFETLDSDGSGGIDVSELFEGIAKLRGDARRSDVVALNFMIQKVQHELKEYSQQCLSILSQHESMLRASREPRKRRARSA